jgi:signal transduction histidine kinase
MMFKRARLRLTVLYIVLFALTIGVFSIVFYVGFATVLVPAFDLGPELTSEQVAQVAYQTTLERVGLALLAADLIVVALVALAAWALAERTLRPIRDAHARQRRFVADASHEIRTPLAAIRSSAEGALASATTVDELRRALAVDARSAERLARITNDLLVLARADDAPTDRHDPIDLSIVVAETVEAFALAHPELPHARLSLGPDLRVAADETDVSRIVANLVDNAFRYSAGGVNATSIVTTTNDREALVEVQDDGPGIAAEDLERIFEPFHRVHAEAGGPDGSGLGLAIARSLAQRNGGRLTVASEPGSGATFRLSLPRLT